MPRCAASRKLSGDVQARYRRGCGCWKGLGNTRRLGTSSAGLSTRIHPRSRSWAASDGLFPQAARVPGIDPQAGLLIGVGAARAQLDAAIGELVQYGHALGDAHGVMVGQDAHAVADADLLGEAAEGAKERVLAWRAREAREEVVFDEPEVVEPHLVGEFALRQRFFVQRVPVNLGALEGALAFV